MVNKKIQLSFRGIARNKVPALKFFSLFFSKKKSRTVTTEKLEKTFPISNNSPIIKQYILSVITFNK